MNNFLDKLQQAWQSQCNTSIDVNPDQLLKAARHQRLVRFCIDIGIISVFVCIGGYMSWSALQNLSRDWPWLISPAGIAWVVGYILFNRLRRRRDAAHYDEPLIAHVDWSIKDIERTMRLDRTSPWWYILPIALGCMIPPVISFSLHYRQRPLLDSLMPLLSVEFVFVVTFAFGFLVMEYGRRMALERQHQELQALRALRSSLLSMDE